MQFYKTLPLVSYNDFLVSLVHLHEFQSLPKKKA